MSDTVVLTVPAKGEYALAVRVLASVVATRVGLDIDGVDDFKLAAEETFILACGTGAAEVTLTFGLADGTASLEAGPVDGPCPDDGPETELRYARFILESVCDVFEILERDGGCVVRVEKRAV
jgi:serine/threonine-protein kinase RsbW